MWYLCCFGAVKQHKSKPIHFKIGVSALEQTSRNCDEIPETKRSTQPGFVVCSTHQFLLELCCMFSLRIHTEFKNRFILKCSLNYCCVRSESRTSHSAILTKIFLKSCYMMIVMSPTEVIIVIIRNTVKDKFYFSYLQLVSLFVAKSALQRSSECQNVILYTML